MGILQKARSSIAWAFRNLTSRASSVLKSLGRSPSPLADRLLSDALRIAEIPSPTEREEQRAAFVIKQLSALGLNPMTDEEGNIVTRLTCQRPDHSAPILLFSDLSSTRWHPLESLSRLDATHAYGAGLADALGPAALLSIAEMMLSGQIVTRKDIVLLFTAGPMIDPTSDMVRRLAEDPQYSPGTAIGIRGVALGTISPRPLGTYRIEVRIRTDTDAQGTVTKPSSAVETIVELARALSGVTWDTENKTTCAIRRVEAGTGFGRLPTEGIIDIELESSDGAVLELAMKAAIATAESKGKEAKAQTTVTIAGHVPVGDPAVGAGLIKLLTQALKDQRLRIIEDNSADPASFFSSLGIPAASIAIASGHEGLSQDQIEIDSIDKGRKLLVSVIERISAEGA
ncbi:MAG TPA: hypothetical protein VMX33_08650 [bacterium]|nr:hypothetical protein [bacterium]